jgi:hypothetical protein
MTRRRTADGYIRVSRRAGREGESFISAELQRKKIADWAKLHEVEILEWWEEIDQSGAKLERPLFQQALARCEAGETGGIVVAKLQFAGKNLGGPRFAPFGVRNGLACLIHTRGKYCHNGGVAVAHPSRWHGLRLTVAWPSPSIMALARLGSTMAIMVPSSGP